MSGGLRLAAALMLTVAGALGACDDAFLTTHGAVDRGNEALGKASGEEAKTAYDEAAAELPESPELNYDRGLALSFLGDQDKAIELFLRALATKDPVLEQKVDAALGLAHARAALALEKTTPAGQDPHAPAPDPSQPGPKADPDAAAAGAREAVLARWKQAVTFLEDALVKKPDDLESRRTLEVALLRVDPPCSARDDQYEQNDVAGTAKLLEPKAPPPPGAPSQSLPNGEPPQAPEPAQSGPVDELKLTEQLFSCPDDDDWYQLKLEPGDRLKVALTVPADSGKLALTLQSPQGAEVATGASVERTIGPNEGGTWLLAVKNVEVDEVSYGLDVSVRPPCDKTEDRFEDDDAGDQAKLLTPGAIPDLKLCPNDEDWYAVDLAEGESLFIYASPTANPGAPEPAKGPDGKAPPKAPPFGLEVRDLTGAVRGTGAPTGDALVSTLLTPGPGRYQVRVWGTVPGWEGRYALRLEVVPPCPDGDDRFEDNDLFADATDFMKAAEGDGQPPQDPNAPPQAPPQSPQQQGPPVVFARVCPGDVDWWTVTDDGQKPAIWTATFDHAQGDLALTLYDESGDKELANSNTSSAQQNGEAVPLPMAPKPDKKDPGAAPAPAPGATPDPAEPAAPPAKKLLLKVAGVGDGQNFYLLRLDRPQPSQSDDKSDKSDKDDEKDKDDKQDQDKEDQDQDKQDQDKKDPREEQDAKDQASQPLQDALDKLDRNPENLEANEAARKSPLASHRPIKDW